MAPHKWTEFTLVRRHIQAYLSILYKIYWWLYSSSETEFTSSSHYTIISKWNWNTHPSVCLPPHVCTATQTCTSNIMGLEIKATPSPARAPDWAATVVATQIVKMNATTLKTAHTREKERQKVYHMLITIDIAAERETTIQTCYHTRRQMV